MSAERLLSAGALALAALLLVATAGAGPDQAAALFDQGVQKFERAEYEEAAAAFLRADDLAPSTETLMNAIAAGRRGHAHLLVARAAQRALARSGPNADLARLAREALTEASAHLARVELSCAPEARPADACEIALDGAKVTPGVHHVLPGTHRFVADVTGGARDEQPLVCNAGATYAVVLRPATRDVAPLPSALPSAGPTTEPPSPGWPPAVVYVGAGATALLAGVSVWSGVDAIDAKNALPAVPARSQNEDVLARANRTNALVASAAVVGVATAVAAIWLVSWEKPGAAGASLGVAPSASGAAMVVRGRF